MGCLLLLLFIITIKETDCNGDDNQLAQVMLLVGSHLYLNLGLLNTAYKPIIPILRPSLTLLWLTFLPLAIHFSSLFPSGTWSASRGAAVPERTQKQEPREGPGCRLASESTATGKKMHSCREVVKLKENYDERSPGRPRGLGSYLIPQAKGHFLKSKTDTACIFIKCCVTSLLFVQPDSHSPCPFK